MEPGARAKGRARGQKAGQGVFLVVQMSQDGDLG